MIAKKWLVATAAAVLSGALVSGVAVAATNPESPGAKVAHDHKMGKKLHLDQLVKEGKITQAQADVMAEIRTLHQKARKQFKADATAVIEKAVKDGKITKEQADQMTKRPMMGPGRHHLERGKEGPATPSSVEG